MTMKQKIFISSITKYGFESRGNASVFVVVKREKRENP